MNEMLGGEQSEEKIFSPQERAPAFIPLAKHNEAIFRRDRSRGA
jgi:hypothetical protein